jgi:glutamate formiminotransferase
MRKLLLAGALLAAVGCKRADANADAGDGEHTRTGTDTVVTTTPVKDTTIVKADTNIAVDTLKKTDNVPDKAKQDRNKR